MPTSDIPRPVTLTSNAPRLISPDQRLSYPDDITPGPGTEDDTAGTTSTTTTVTGNCKKSNKLETCGKDAECLSDPEQPCTGTCKCDKDGINECLCVGEDGCGCETEAGLAARLRGGGGSDASAL